MSAPDKIYLVHDQPTGCLFVNYDKPDPSNLEYVRKDTLLEWAKDQEVDAKFATTDGIYYAGREHAFRELIEKLESL